MKYADYAVISKSYRVFNNLVHIGENTMAYIFTTESTENTE